MKPPIVLAIAALLVASFMLLWIWRSEWVEVQSDAGVGPKARANSFLAAEQFLTGRGTQTRHVDVDSAKLPLPPTNFVLLFAANRAGLTQDARDELRKWVRAGGHLITVPALDIQGHSEVTADPLLYELGIVAILPPDDEGDDAGDDSREDSDNAATTPEGAASVAGHDDEPRYNQDGCLTNYNAQARLGASTEALRVATADRTRLGVPEGSASAAADAQGVLLAQRTFGKGLVTATANTELWQNQAIRCFDHAHLLYRLVAGRKGVWVIDSATRGDWRDLVWTHGKAMLWTLALLTGLLIWRFARAFGPPVEVNADVRRERAEHLRAVGEFLWRHRDTAALLAGMRELVRRNARRRIGTDDAIEALATRAGVDPRVAAAAMHTAPRNERQLIATTRCLKELIKAQ